MKNVTVVTSKGQITIPKHIRDRKGIAAGTRIEVAEKDEDIVLRKAKRSRDPRAKRDVEFDAYLERITGSMDIGMSTDEFMELLRGE